MSEESTPTETPSPVEAAQQAAETPAPEQPAQTETIEVTDQKFKVAALRLRNKPANSRCFVNIKRPQGT